MKLRLTGFKSNTYEDTDGTCEDCMYTGDARPSHV